MSKHEACPEIADMIKDTVAAAGAKPVKPLGRPPKKPAPTVPTALGIVRTPTNVGAEFEMVYTNPVMFKKMFAVLKKFNVSEIELVIDAEGVTIETTNRDKNTAIKIVINGAYMTQYYCAAPTRVWVTMEKMSSWLELVGPKHGKITWLLHANAKNVLTVILSDTDYGSDGISEVDTFQPQGKILEEKVIYDDSDYPLKFKVATAHLKKKIQSVTKGQSRGALVIQKAGTGHVQLSMERAGATIFTEVYSDSSKMGVESKLSPEDVLLVSVPAAPIKAFISQDAHSAAKSGEIYVCADPLRRTSFMAKTDVTKEGCAAYIKIFTEQMKAKAK